MIHAAVQCFRVDAQIADAKRFKEQTAGLQVVQQITWANAQRCSGDRRIDKIACVRCANRCLGAKIRTPGRAILYHKDLFQRIRIGDNGILTQFHIVADIDILADRGVRCLCSLMTRKRTHQEPCAGLIAGNAVHSADIGLHNGIQVVKGLYQCIVALQEGRLGPAAATDEKCNILQCSLVFRKGWFIIGGKQRTETDCAGGLTGLIQAHGPHLDPRKAAGTRMMHLLHLRRHSGTGQQEVSEAVPVIHFKPHSIPQLGSHLPFVDQARRLTLEEGTRADIRQLEVLLYPIRVAHIQNTGGVLFAGGCFSTPFCSFHKDRSFVSQAICNSQVNHSRLITCHIESLPAIE